MQSILIAAVALLAGLNILLLVLLSRSKAKRLRLLDDIAHADHERTLAVTDRNEIDRRKDSFVSSVSHQVRTPLTAVRGALGLLAAGLLGNNDPKAQNLLRIALINTDRLIRLINDTLDLERIQTGRSVLQEKPLSLLAAANTAIQSCNAAAEGANVSLVLLTPPGQPEPLVTGDADRLIQVVEILLSNAIKFSPTRATVQVTVETLDTDILLRVIDEGRGISADQLESVFERFHYADAADARQGGSGLGLSLARAISRRHGGTVWAERNPTAGVTFIVSLPRLKDTPQQAAARQTSITSLATSTMPSTGSATPTVIICDDDPDVRIIVRDHLERGGYTVVETARGEQAIAFARQHPVDAILLDPYLPGISGWQTLAQLRQTESTASIPVAILSVLSPSDRQALASTAQGRMPKPFNDQALLADLQQVLTSSNGNTRLLLLENNTDLAAVFLNSFQLANIALEHLLTQKDALTLCQQNPPELIVLNLSMPDQEAFSFIASLQNHSTLRTIPLVAYASEEIADTEPAKLQLIPTQLLTRAKIQPPQIDPLIHALLGHLQKPAAHTHTQ